VAGFDASGIPCLRCRLSDSRQIRNEARSSGSFAKVGLHALLKERLSILHPEERETPNKIRCGTGQGIRPHLATSLTALQSDGRGILCFFFRLSWVFPWKDVPMMSWPILVRITVGAECVEYANIVVGPHSTANGPSVKLVEGCL